METTTKRKNLKWTKENPKPTVCTLDSCKNKYYARGLCKHHYERDRQNLALVPVYKNESDCSFEGCESKAKSRGLCTAHYQQYKMGGMESLKPVKPHLFGVEENGRVCKDCNEFKPWSEFYTHTRAKWSPHYTEAGKHWSNCKECVKERQRPLSRAYAQNQKALTNG